MSQDVVESLSAIEQRVTDLLKDLSLRGQVRVCEADLAEVRAALRRCIKRLQTQ